MYAKDDYDAFFDRTGRIEKRNEMKKKTANQVETYETLVAKQKIVMSQMKALEDDIAQLERATADSAQSNSDDLDSFMVELNVTLQKEKISRKQKLLQEFKNHYERLSSLSKLVKPALSGLSDTSNFTENQLKLISQFEQELKKKKSDTDNDTRDRSAEKKQQIHKQMKNMAKTSRFKTGQVQVEVPISDSNNPQPTDSSQIPTDPNTPEEPSRSFNVPLPEIKDSTSPTYQPSLLSGVAEAIQKQKKVEMKKENESNTDDDDEDNPSTKNKKKKKKKTTFDQDHQNYDSFEPPEGQTGDGKTYLNEKYGY